MKKLKSKVFSFDLNDQKTANKVCEFVEKEGISREDIVIINSSNWQLRTWYTIWYYA